jgi:hypothetical protein
MNKKERKPVNATVPGVSLDTTYQCTLNVPCLAALANYEKSQPFDCLPPEYGFRVGTGGATFKYALVQVCK